LCSQLAKTGSGDPDRSPLTLNNSFSYGTATFRGTVVMCGFEMISATPGIDAFVRMVPGSDGESFELRVRIPYRLAQNMTAPLQLVVRTPRGVRLVDMGLPPKVEVDPQGHIEGLDSYVKNCLYFFGAGLLVWGGLAGESKHLSVDIFKPPPLEGPGWSEFLGGGHGLSLQLLTLSGLEPGELVQFRSSTHAIDASADTDGGLIIPALLQLQSSLAPALLERASRRTLAGHVSVQTFDFEYIASLPRTETAPRLALTRDGRAVIGTRHLGREAWHIIATDGTRLRFQAKRTRKVGAEVMLNPQPLPPEPPPNLEEMRRRWPGIVDVITLPHSNDALAVALRDDGTQLLVNRRADGAMRIAGRLSGPVGRLTTVGGWAVASGRAGVQLLRQLQ